MRRTRRDIERRAELLGLNVSTWSPGDGATRYRFSRLDLDYFELGGNNDFTALGVAEADAMLDAYLYGLGAQADEGLPGEYDSDDLDKLVVERDREAGR